MFTSENSDKKQALSVFTDPGAVVCQSLKGTILSWNAGAEALFGFGEAEAVGQNISLVIPPEQRLQESLILHRLTSGERISRHKTAWRSKEGDTVDIFLTVFLLYDELGRVMGVAQIAKPVAALEEAEAEMARGVVAEDFDWVELARLRHDVRTPLNAVLGIANLLPASGPFSSRQEEMIAALKSSSAHLHQKIEDLFIYLSPKISGAEAPSPHAH